MTYITGVSDRVQVVHGGGVIRDIPDPGPSIYELLPRARAGLQGQTM